MCLWVPQRCLKSYLLGRGEHLFNDSGLNCHPCWQAAPCYLSKSPGTQTQGDLTDTQTFPRHNTLAFIALAVLLGGTFSFCDRRRTVDLPVSSGGKNRKSQFSVLLSPVTFLSLKICRLILERQAEGRPPLELKKNKNKTTEHPFSA